MATICNSTLQLMSFHPHQRRPLHAGGGGGAAAAAEEEASSSSSTGWSCSSTSIGKAPSLKSGSSSLHLNNSNNSHNERIWRIFGMGPRPSTGSRKRGRGRPVGRNFSVFAGGMDVPDFLPATWNKEKESKPIGPSFDLTAEGAVNRQLDALQANDHPYPDHGVEVMYRFAGFDPFRRSTYFGPTFDLGQFERFRRIFHHSTYRVLLSHKERRILSSLFLDEHCFKQRVWVGGARPGEEEIFEVTLVQRVGGNWDGYWLTDSLHNDGQGMKGGIAY